MYLNEETNYRRSVELGKAVGVTRQTAVKWITGEASPETTIKSILIDLYLNMMVAKAEPGETFTLREIAKQTGMTHERVRQIQDQALRKLRQKTKGIQNELNR